MDDAYTVLDKYDREIKDRYEYWLNLLKRYGSVIVECRRIDGSQTKILVDSIDDLIDTIIAFQLKDKCIDISVYGDQ